MSLKEQFKQTEKLCAQEELCVAHQRWNATRRATCEAQPDCHPADAAIGGEQWKESVKMRLHVTSTWM